LGGVREYRVRERRGVSMGFIGGWKGNRESGVS
jgi:hypothetical protein